MVNGSVENVLFSDVEISGLETCQHPWRAWCGYLSATVEYHAELVKVDTLMEYHEELVRVDILMEYHEKSVMMDSLMECHEEFAEYLRTRGDEGIGTSADLWESVFSE